MTVFDLTKYILEKEPNAPLTRIHNLLYYIQADYLWLNHNPLFSNKLLAWEYGVLIPDLYEKQLKEEDYLPETTENLEYSIKEIINKVLGDHQIKSAHWLGVLTTKELAWKKAKKCFWKEPEITPSLILENYGKMSH